MLGRSTRIPGAPRGFRVHGSGPGPAARKGFTISSPSGPSRPGPDPADPWQQEPELPADSLEDWTQEPDPELADTSDRVSPRSELTAWLTEPAPRATSSLEDWLQGPVEAHVEQEAEDAWSTADAITGTWRDTERGRTETPAVGTETPATGTAALTSATAPVATAAPTADGSPAVREHPSGTALSAPATPPQPSRRAFRRELHGLRALALLLVAVYHIWLGRVSGGVDVFLFLSAFLLTGTFVRRLEGGRPLAVPRYWLHTFKRLLPPAALVILLSLAATAALLPPSQWATVMRQAVASVTYVQNIALVVAEVDYQARDASSAPLLQHFWSLSMQGQVFVVWPLLFYAVARRARSGRPVRGPLAMLFTLIGAASLAWSIHSTQTQQQVAYFDTTARLWEFAAGSLLALALPWLDRVTGARRPEDEEAPRLGAVRALTGWAGIVGLLACGIVVDVSGSFPGWIAIWPLGAAGAVVLAGYSGRRWGADALLSTRPAAVIGDISYALYLVHWPLLVLWLHHSDQERAGLADGLAVLAVSLVLAWLITRAVDSPVRRSAWLEARAWRSLTAVAASIALVVGASGAWWTLLTRDSTETEEPGVAEPTLTLPTDEVPTSAPPQLQPKGWELDKQWPNLPHRCGGPWKPEEPFNHVTCQQLLPGDASAERTIVVVGSSHSRQQIPAMRAWAEENDTQIVNLSMDGCWLHAGVAPDDYCAGYEQYVYDYLDRVEPDLVVATVTRALQSPEDPEFMPGSTEVAVQNILDRGIDVVAVRDNPKWAKDQYECAEAVIEDGGTPEDANAECGADVEDKLLPENPARALADLEGADGAGVTLVDHTEAFCPDGRCAPILGEIYVYMDDGHLTKDFVRAVLTPTMTEMLEELEREGAI